MNQKIYTLLFLLFVFATANAQITVTDASINAGDVVTWTADNEYLLDGFVFVEEGATLNIEAGTVIKGKEVPSTGESTSALIISRGAKIFALGTSTNPVIFTAEIDDVTDPSDLGPEDNGFWGGLIILGRASITADAPCKQIEGIPSGEDRALYGVCDDEGGAANFDDNDDSGVLNYVSIRHGGAALAPGNEINGLTLGAVGAQTEIRFVEVMANFDDGIEWFGGTVSVYGAVVSHCGDDAIDFDQGWQGGGQYWAIFVDENGDRGGEHDGASGGDDNDPESDPQIYNATFIGSWGADRAVLFRDGSSGLYANSIFTRFNTGLEVEDTGDTFDSESNFLNGDLELFNNIWWDFSAGNGAADFIVPASSDVITQVVNSNNEIIDPELVNIPAGSAGNLTGGLDPRPVPDGNAMTSELFAVPNDGFYTEPMFKGAFCQDGVWLNGWTAVSEYGVIAANIPSASLDGTDPACFVVNTEDLEVEEKGYKLMQNTPNPAVNATQIAFELPETTNVSIVIYDMTGRIIDTPISSSNLSAGIHLIDVDLSNYQGGVYYYTLTNNDVTISKRMLVH